MSITDVATGEAALAAGQGRRSSSATVVLTAGIKALFAAVSGLLLTCSIGVVVWAITPSSGAGPVALLRAGVAAFCAGNGMTLTIGRAALTLPPLMITLGAIALLTTVSGRGRVVAGGRAQELATTVAATAVYAVTVTCSGVIIAPPHTVQAEQWWRPAVLAFAVVGATTVVRGVGWRLYLLERLPPWVPVSIRLGATGTVAMLGGGAIVMAVGLVLSFSDATTVQLLASPGVGGGLGMTLLGIAYLPNAVVAGAGYASGVGFSIGGGTYSPLGSSPTELPAVTLLTAVPDGAVFARSALLVLIVPLLVAVLIGRAATSRLGRRGDRVLAVCGAAILAGVVLGLVAAVASGGITGGEWSSTGVPPVLFGLAVMTGLGVVGAGVAAVGRVRTTEGAGQLAADADLENGVADGEIADHAAADTDPTHDEIAEDDVADSDALISDVADADVADSDTAAAAADTAAADTAAADTAAADTAAADAVVEAESGERTAGAPSADPPAADRPREEDLIAAAEAETDADLIGDLSRRSAPRQVG